MKGLKKTMGPTEESYYFGGQVPREVQERLSACRDRGMTNQTIARKLAYLWLRLSPEQQHQLYFSMVDDLDQPADKTVLDLMRVVDDVIEAQVLSLLPASMRAVETVVSGRRRAKRQKPSHLPPDSD